ncbi:TPA: GspH/FimT family pseudopilin [Legionella pneumophila]|uniref:GspH/FimT family pseudopilin n=1 Tax=Legionella sp. PATHC032 TaxID=2992039 RepID=UPI001A358C40|nr:GspH/FimT family pseudopilin [Legionella sp. PATHC032]HAT9045308.1 prepilin-type N-terminal cleavage/methylation domain-containing protein [Legionella pneumophila subsp. pneumophila]HAZ7574385.1 prepilin-type N-terminal cleavage/methylation domain-containing protein [Legionella pneumophila]HBA1636546.1 prepilin-type N-terminal cleavage/methylation domain-containing protein [Legionella pneumophila]
MNKVIKESQKFTLRNLANMLFCVDRTVLPTQSNIANIQTKSIIYNDLCKDSFDTEVPLNSNPLSIAGFTLVELLVTLSVFAIILTLIVPSLRTMILNNRLTSNIDSLVSSLNYARGVALDRAVNVAVCPLGSPGSTACGANWSSGWIVVTQPVAGAPTLLKTHQTSVNDPVITSNVASVVFDPHGLSTTQSNFTMCDNRGNAFARSAMVLATGFVQSGSVPGQAVWNNGALNCP